MSIIKFQGNCPKNVSKDAKYTIRREENDYVVTILYETENGEIWYMSTENHRELVDLVGMVKKAFGQPPLGSFYINEYKQVIVPVIGSNEYYLAGTYNEPLEFEFEGNIISGKPLYVNGNALKPKDKWLGLHPGIPYILAAGGNDIRYTKEIRPNVTRNVLLSKFLGKETAKYVANMIREVKGYGGGRFYVNEFCSIFTPINEADKIDYIYIGQLDLDKWFPNPHIGL